LTMSNAALRSSSTSTDNLPVCNGEVLCINYIKYVLWEPD